MALPTLEEVMLAAETAIEAEASLDFFESRIDHAQAGWFEEGLIVQPNLVISPANKAPQPTGSRLTSVRDDVITLVYYAYQRGFGTRKGLFGETGFKGITEIGDALEAFLITSKLGGIAIPDWQGTEYPTYTRNFETLGQVQVTIAYRVRGTP